MSVINTLKFIANHPLNKSNKVKALLQLAKWQISCLFNPFPVIFPFGERSKLIVSKSQTGATGNLYCGLDEFEDMAFLLHFLREEDLFIDIGANIGSYTILAAKEVGAETVSTEPIPATFEKLMSNINLNAISGHVKSLNIGIGGEDGVIKFTKDLDSVNHVATADEKDTIDVKIAKLDDILELNKPALIKIDVEGYESEVLKGMQNILNSPHLKAIIIELNGSGHRYRFSDEEIHNGLLELCFSPFSYFPFERKLLRLNKYGQNNTIYIKDIEFVQSRISTAKKFEILGNKF